MIEFKKYNPIIEKVFVENTVRQSIEVFEDKNNRINNDNCDTDINDQIINLRK
jgi:hypothetical protein